MLIGIMDILALLIISGIIYYIYKFIKWVLTRIVKKEKVKLFVQFLIGFVICLFILLIGFLVASPIKVK
jgi:hypothetical protein